MSHLADPAAVSAVAGRMPDQGTIGPWRVAGQGSRGDGAVPVQNVSPKLRFGLPAVVHPKPLFRHSANHSFNRLSVKTDHRQHLLLM